MKPISLFLAAALLLGTSCKWKHIRGSGVIVTEERGVSRVEKISLAGGYDVEITQGPTASVKVEGDDNIVPLIMVNEEDGVLRIRPKKNINYSTDHEIKIFITTGKLSQVKVNGSGNVTGKGNFTGSDELELEIRGSGSIRLEVNTPALESDIVGSGTITVNGETQKQKIHISGNGVYNGDGLKSENAAVRIAGSGDVKVFADATLDIHVTGSGSIYYKGNPTITQKIVGGGEVRKMN